MAKMTSSFGYRNDPVNGEHKHHNGCDFSAPTGTPIYANSDMKVVRSEYNNGGYGNMVVAQDAAGNKYTMAHMDQRNVAQGDTVPAGSIIGYTGNTGKSTGAHLHYEATDPSGKKIDPQSTNPNTGKPYTDSVGFEPGKGLNASSAVASKDKKPQSDTTVASNSSKATDKFKTETDTQKDKRVAEEATKKTSTAPAKTAPSGRPKASDVGILENPLNKL